MLRVDKFENAPWHVKDTSTFHGGEITAVWGESDSEVTLLTVRLFKGTDGAVDWDSNYDNEGEVWVGIIAGPEPEPED